MDPLKFFQRIFKYLSKLFNCYKQKITLSYDNQQNEQLEYIYDLYFDHQVVDSDKIQQQFQWLDGIDSKEKFLTLKIKNDYLGNGLDSFYNNVATIQQSSEAVKQYLNGSIFVCLKDYAQQVEIDKDLKEFHDNNNQQMKPETSEDTVFNLVREYAMKILKKQQFQQCDMDTLFGKKLYGDSVQELSQFGFYTKSADVNTYQKLIMVNKIKPKNLKRMRKGQSIVKEILRVERLLQSKFKLRPEHLHYAAISAKNHAGSIQDKIANQIEEARNALELTQQYQNQIVLQNDDVELRNQIKQIHIIANQYKWEEGETLNDILQALQINFQKTQDSLNRVVDKLNQLHKKYSNVEEFELGTKFIDWQKLVQEIKTNQKIYHMFQSIFPSNKSLILNKKEFIEIMQYLI